MIIWEMRIACWIRSATVTRLIPAALLRHHWLCECASALRYAYVYCLCCLSVTFVSPSNGPFLLSCWCNFKSITNATFSKVEFQTRKEGRKEGGKEGSCRQHCRFLLFYLNTVFLCPVGAVTSHCKIHYISFIMQLFLSHEEGGGCSTSGKCDRSCHVMASWWLSPLQCAHQTVRHCLCSQI
jgi:hypothetical protein